MVSSYQSIFNAFAGKMNYNMQESLDDYFIGRRLVDVTIKDFEFVETNVSGEYTLKLRDEFNDFWFNYRTKIQLDVIIDVDYLTSLGIDYKGLDFENLENFTVYELTLIKDGIEREVQYA